MSLTKKEQRLRRSRQTRVRIALQGTARLAVHRSNLHIYASIISDDGANVFWQAPRPPRRKFVTNSVLQARAATSTQRP